MADGHDDIAPGQITPDEIAPMAQWLDVVPSGTANGLATYGSAPAALIAHLTKIVQKEVDAKALLRRRLMEAEALNTTHSQRIDTLERHCASLVGEVDRHGLMSRKSGESVVALGTALDAARHDMIRQEALIADMLSDPTWRAGGPWRYLRRLWTRHMRRRSPSRMLSEHFDAQWFADRYQEVDRLERDPFDYFMTHGLERDLNPNPCFDMRWYLRRHPDVATLGVHPLIHFAAHGFAEGRDPHPDFSCAEYRVLKEAGWPRDWP